MAYKYQTFADLLYGSNSRLRFRIVILNEKRAVYVMSVVSDLNSLRFQNGTSRSNNLEVKIDKRYSTSTPSHPRSARLSRATK